MEICSLRKKPVRSELRVPSHEQLIAACLVIASFITLLFPLAVLAAPTLTETGFIRTTPFVQSSINIGDNEGSAYAPPDDALWIVDDQRDQLAEVDQTTGSLRRIVDKTALMASVELGRLNTATLKQVKDMESLAYNQLTDQLFVFNGKCCESNPGTPTVFRLTRQGGQLQPESFQKLSGLVDFSGAASHPSTGELWVSEGKSVFPYDYDTNTVGPAVQLPVRGNIYGLGFSVDGSELFMVTSNKRVYRLSMANMTLVEGFSPETTGVSDPRSILEIGSELLIGDGFGDLGDDPRAFAVIRYSVSDGLPPPSTDITSPEAILSSPENNSDVANIIVLQGTTTDDVGVSKVRYFVRDRNRSNRSSYLQPDGSFGRAHWFLATVDSVGATTSIFSAELPALSQSSYYTLVQAIDAAGNVQSTKNRTYFDVVSNVDSMPPEAVLTAPENKSDVLNTVVLQGTTTDDVGVSKVRFFVRDRNRASRSSYLQPDGSFGRAHWFLATVDSVGATTSTFSAELPALSQSSYYTLVQAIDAAGNVQSTKNRTYFDVVRR